MFMKPLNQVTLDDIKNLITQWRFKENERIEYKSTLPNNGKNIDLWLKGENKIGDIAISKLVAEIIAFANTQGGTLIIGIQENIEKPPRPDKIIPLPRCHELDQRLMHSITDSIEPGLPFIQSQVIDTDSDGNGIILIHVERSDNAPHRSTKDKQCYFRAQDRCMQMSMVDIQNLALKRSRQKIEGLWTVKFGVPGQYMNGGVVVLENGKLYGGDSQYFYTGIFELLENENLISNIFVEHYHGEVYTAFGTNEKSFPVSLNGKMQGNTISGTLYKNSPPQIQIATLLERKRMLP